MFLTFSCYCNYCMTFEINLNFRDRGNFQDWWDNFFSRPVKFISGTINFRQPATETPDNSEKLANFFPDFRGFPVLIDEMDIGFGFCRSKYTTNREKCSFFLDIKVKNRAVFLNDFVSFKKCFQKICTFFTSSPSKKGVFLFVGEM